MSLIDIGRNLPEFILSQNLRWFDISTCTPASNIFNLLNLYYFTKNKEIYVKLSDSKDSVYHKIVDINYNNPFLELAKHQKNYRVSYYNSFGEKQSSTISMPSINNLGIKNSMKFL